MQVPRGPRERALAALFESRRAGLTGAVRGILGPGDDAAAVVQDAFVKALLAIRGGDAPQRLGPWLFVVTMNLAKDRRRSSRRAPPVASLDDLGDRMEFAIDLEPPTERLARDEAVAAARAAIHALGDAEKDVFLLRVSGGLSFEDTAATLGIPIGTAKTRMRSALARLRGALAAHAPADTTPRSEDAR